MELVAKGDNMQAISAVTTGYNKKLRFLERPHECFISTVHELILDDQLVVEYCPTLAHRGDGFTKALTPAKFLAAREVVSMKLTKTA